MVNKNYKVKCVGYKKSERYFTIGKVYNVIDGKITADNGYTYKNEPDIIKWLSGWYEFEIVSDYDIVNVIFNDPATIVIWGDGTKTVVKCQPGDTYDAEKGLALCISKKFLGNKGNFNEVFKKWIPEDIPKPVERIDLTPIKPGDRVKIINGGCGAYGANGKTGVVMNPGCYIGYHSGLTDRDLGYYVKTENNQIWKIALNAEIEIL